jgi:DNA-binding beta-propeller fold protein YncE
MRLTIPTVVRLVLPLALLLTPGVGAESTRANYAVGAGPEGLVFDGLNLWVANNQGGNVTKLLASTGATVGSYIVGTNPTGIAFDGTNIWVTNSGSDDVTKLLASTGAMTGTPSARAEADDWR